jgi:hypothetical protein
MAPGEKFALIASPFAKNSNSIPPAPHPRRAGMKQIRLQRDDRARHPNGS